MGVGREGGLCELDLGAGFIQEMEYSGNSYVVYGQLPWREEFKNNLIAEKDERSRGEGTKPWSWNS